MKLIKYLFCFVYLAGDLTLKILPHIDMQSNLWKWEKDFRAIKGKWNILTISPSSCFTMMVHITRIGLHFTHMYVLSYILA